MKTVAASLLLTLGLPSLTAAEVPTFTLGDPKSYLGNVYSTAVGGNDIIVNDGNGVTITFGTELSKRLVDVAVKECKDRNSPECMKQTLDLMGVGSAGNGLQKRTITALEAGVGVFLAYIAGGTWTNIYDVLDDPKDYKVVELKIPQSQVKRFNPHHESCRLTMRQVDEVSKWKLDEGKFNFKPPTGDVSVVQVDTDQPKPAKMPTIEKQPNGDIKVTLPDMVDDLATMWKKVKCARSLQKRITMQCLVQYAQAIMRLAQDGGK